MEALLRNGPNVKYEPNRAYADAKLIVAWWAAALARRLPSGMAVYAVSPGAATDTKVVRNAGPLLKYLFIPIVNLIPGMNQTPETAARRYLQASEFGTDVSGQFFASAHRKLTAQLRRCATPPPRSRQPGSRVAGRRQGLRRRLVLPSILERGVLKERRSRSSASSGIKPFGRPRARLGILVTIAYETPCIVRRLSYSRVCIYSRQINTGDNMDGSKEKQH